jgi:F-type H+-transporting ATPase subunit gamma
MPNLKDIRNRISSVESTKQITNAMKMVAAAKLRKAQKAVQQLRPYANKLQEILTHISASESENTQSPYTEQREEEKIVLLAISSNKGLCGPFNTNVAKTVMDLCSRKYSEQYQKGNVKIITAGKKVAEILKSKGYESSEQYDDIFNDLSSENVSAFAQKLMNRFTNEEFDKLELVYNSFKNAAVQELQTEQFLPVEESKKSEHEDTFFSDYIYEPSEEYIMENLIPDSIKIQAYKAFLDSSASEHGARMTAMHMATDNAAEMIKDLKLTYNKARQATITKEINEITAGAEALKG